MKRRALAVTTLALVAIVVLGLVARLARYSGRGNFAEAIDRGEISGP